MAAKTWFATSSLASVHQEMSETDPGTEVTASPTTGWVVSTGASGTAPFNSQVEQAATTFTGTHPDGSIDTTAGDCLRSTNAYTGSFASANWTVYFAARATTVGGAQDGRMLCRLFRSANADGSGATEITGAAQTGSTVTNLATSATQVSSVAFNPGAFSVSGEYIFVQLAWERTGAGGMTTSDVNMRVGNTSGSGTRVVSSNFTATFERAADSSAASDAAVSGTFWTTFERSAASSAAADAVVSGVGVPASTTYERSAAASAASDAVVAGDFWTTFEASAASSATADATVAGLHIHVRSAASSASGDAVVSGTVIAGPVTYERSAASAATTDAVVAGQRDLLRAAAASASTGAAVAAITVHVRSAASSAATDATVAGQRDLLRQVAASAATDAVVSGTIAGGAVERSAAASATADAAVSGEFWSIFERSAASSATATAAVAGLRIVERSAASSAATDAVVAYQRAMLRSALASATADAAASGGRVGGDVERSTTANAAVAVVVEWMKFRPEPQHHKHKAPPRTVSRARSFAETRRWSRRRP